MYVSSLTSRVNALCSVICNDGALVVRDWIPASALKNYMLETNTMFYLILKRISKKDGNDTYTMNIKSLTPTYDETGMCNPTRWIFCIVSQVSCLQVPIINAEDKGQDKWDEWCVFPSSN